MATTYHDQKNPPIYKVIHFTPTARHCWCWMVVIPAITLSGPQPTVTGERVNAGDGMTMWSSLPGAPSFGSRAEAARWADLMRLPNTIYEI